VLKSHTLPTPTLAWAVDEVTPGVRVFGGICCDHPVGGVNPDAVSTALHAGAKIVWLPTLSSQQDIDSGTAARLKKPTVRGLRVVDESGSLTSETREVIDLVAAHGAILATGHISAAEHLAVTKHYASRGKLIVTHAMERLAGAALTIDQCVELAGLGAFLELSAMTCIGNYASLPPAKIAACVSAVGYERCTLATDYGQNTGNAHPAAGLQLLADAMAAEGFGEKEVRRMACDNPIDLLEI
jgi:hypothetical protein